MSASCWWSRRYGTNGRNTSQDAVPSQTISPASAINDAKPLSFLQAERFVVGFCASSKENARRQQEELEHFSWADRAIDDPGRGARAPQIEQSQIHTNKSKPPATQWCRGKRQPRSVAGGRGL